MHTELKKWRSRVVLGLQVLLLVLLAGYAVRSLTPLRPLVPASVDEWYTNLLYGGSTLLVALRAVWVRADRLAWALLGAGLATYTLSNIYYYQVVSKLDPIPFPSLCDVGWLAFYPFAYAAAVLLVRRRLVRFHASMWLDGLLAGLTVGALGVAFVLPAVVQSTGGSLALVAVNLAYPIVDLLMLTLMLGVFALFNWQPDRVWWVMALGLTAFAVADAGYLFQIAEETYTVGGPLDLLWNSGMVLPALAAWQPMRETARVRLEGWAVLAVPAVLTLLSLALLTYAGVRRVPVGAVLLAAAAVVAALVRTGLTFREVRALGEARLQARTDELTGLPNRRSFHERTQVALDRRGLSGKLVVLLIDLDRFKEINDSFGHPMGDALLRMVGPRLSRVLRDTDVVARLGGDEFGIVLADADAGYAAEIAGRLRSELRRPFDLKGLSVTLDASIGIAVCPSHGDGTDLLLQRADIAMYSAKAARTGYEVYAVNGDSRSRQRLQTLEQLRTALAQDQLVVHYQPQLDLATGRVSAVEALVRWEHPLRGLIHPEAFLPVGEQAGLMRLVTLAVLEKALRQAADWRAAGLDLRVAVNLSTTNLHDTGLPAQIQFVLESLELPATALQLEITESVLMSDPDRALQVINALRALGVTLSIDDYGTGFSSLSYLRALPVQELKLDRAFVTHMDTDPRSEAIVYSTIALAHSLGVVMVAEGVEHTAVLRQLTAAGCDLAQGFHIARPAPADQLTPWLRERAGTGAR